MPPISVRQASEQDATAISRLMPDLGYTAKPQEVARRLLLLNQRLENEVVVAVRNQEVLGLCHVQGVPLIASDGYAEVQALVVAAACQRTGVGKVLLAYAVSWAATRGYQRIRLRSGLHREEAHLFYESQGFSRSKASYAFEAQLASSDA
jgi:GNAT superfamily N-acetyltransferase